MVWCPWAERRCSSTGRPSERERVPVPGRSGDLPQPLIHACTQRPLRRSGTRRRGPSAGRCFPTPRERGGAGVQARVGTSRRTVIRARCWLPPRLAVPGRGVGSGLDRSMRPFGSRRRGPPAGRLFRAPRHRVHGGVRWSGRGASSPGRVPLCARVLAAGAAERARALWRLPRASSPTAALRG